MRQLTKYLYLLFIFSFVLPSGSVFNIPIKTVLSLVILVAFIFSGISFKVDKCTKYCFIIFLFLGLWSGLALLNNFSTSLSFLKNYFSLLFVVWLSYELHKYNFVKSRSTVIALLVVCFSIIAVKLMSSLSLSLGILEINSTISFYKTVLNADLTTMYFPIGNFMFYRLMLSNDSLPFVVFSFCLLFKLKKKTKAFLFFLMGIYTFVIFSRMIMLVYLLVAIAFIIVYCHENKKRLSKKSGSILIASIFVVFASLIILIYSNLGIWESIKYRFTGTSSSVSDSIRNEQFNFLVEGIKTNWYIGHGTGSYLKEYIRSETLLYSYEIEYLSFIYQFGIIGFCLIIGFTIYLFYKLCFINNNNFNVRIMIWLNFLIWIIKPFFNPSFLSSNSGIIIVSIMIFGIEIQKMKQINYQKTTIEE